MPTEPLTVDLDADEPAWLERIVPMLERFQGSEIVISDQARDDLGVLIDLLKKTMER